LNVFLEILKPEGAIEFESGYRLINYLVRVFSDNYTIFLFVECGLNLMFICLFLRSMPITNHMAGLLYLFSIAVFPIRYTLASNIILFSYSFILKKKFVPYILLILLAFSIHRMTIIFLPLYFIARKEYSFKTILFIYGTCIVLGILSDFTFGNILRSATALYGNMSEVVQGKMDAYITGDIPHYAKMTPLRYCLSLVNSTFFILLFYYFKQRLFTNNAMYNMLFNLYVFGISFNRIVFQLIPDLARLTSLFSGGFIIMIIMILSRYNKSVQLFGTIILVGYIFGSFYSSINGTYRDLFFPYYSVFSNMERVNVY